ncbi:MAG: type II toxin-antitoxin system RelE/ParE family toxin [Anaerolineales bacterium]|nr:type II toxin-antitoxin system RelE/ParE family toxin [Anaerolineales bacterium]
MAYQVILKRSAEKELDALQANLRERILRRLLALEENPRPSGIKKLQGQESFRLRVGDYRVLYTIDDKSKQVFIVGVGHRREVYR